MKLKQFALTLAAVITMGLAHAGDCAVHYTRTACPGKDAESYAKCDGKMSCVKTSPADNETACQALALKACANDRLDITKSKEIAATFNGQALKSGAGKADFCLDYAKREAEFNHCGK